MKKEHTTEYINIKKKIISWVRFLFSVGIIFGIGYVILNYVPFIAKYDQYVIATGSMEPVISVGDITIIDTSVSLDDLEPGDIIAFYADIRGNGTKDVIVHNLYSISEIEGVRIFTTKPEITDSLDPWDLIDEDIIGIHVLTIAKIGPFLMFAQSTIGRIVIVLDIILIYVVVQMFSDKKKSIVSDKEDIKELKEIDD